MASYNSILFEVDGVVATLTLNRPDNHNALNLEMSHEIQQALRVIELESNIRALILTGAGGDFCSGHDHGDLSQSEPNALADYSKAWHSSLAGIRACCVPVIVAVNGSAIGDGCLLALCADLLFASYSAEFVHPSPHSDVLPDLGLSPLLPQLIGLFGSHHMTTNERVSASQALQRGIINECLEEGQLLSRAREWAAKLAEGPTRALTMTRQLVDESPGNSFEAQYRRELEVNSELRECVDSKEGVQAFLEKRPARFRGE
jgi:2-(1,2-epoxy-1,2-dihydrophenyl)acetyl-CoA isomerase